MALINWWLENWLWSTFLVAFVGVSTVEFIKHVSKRMKIQRDPVLLAEFKDRKAMAKELQKKELAGIDVRPEEHKSYINDDTGEIFLRSHKYDPDQKSTVLHQSEEWIIKDGTITINKANQGSKTVLISHLSGAELETPENIYSYRLKLFIAGGRTSQTFWGTGGVSGLANHIINFDARDIDIARMAHAHITEVATRNITTAQSPSTSVADELSKLKVLLDDGVLTQEEFNHKKNKLLGIGK